MKPLTKRILLVLADILTLVLSCFVAFYLSELLGFTPSDVFIRQWYVIVGIKLAVYLAFAMYSTDPDRLAVLDFAGSGVANLAADAALIYLFSVPIRTNIMPFSISLVWDILLCFLLRVMLMPREEIYEEEPDEYDSAEIKMAEKQAVYFPGAEKDIETEPLPDEPPALPGEVPEMGELNLESLFEDDAKDYVAASENETLRTAETGPFVPAGEQFTAPEPEAGPAPDSEFKDESDMFDFSSLDIDFPDDEDAEGAAGTDEVPDEARDDLFPELGGMDIDSILEGMSDDEFGTEAPSGDDDLYGEDDWTKMADELGDLEWDDSLSGSTVSPAGEEDVSVQEQVLTDIPETGERQESITVSPPPEDEPLPADSDPSIEESAVRDDEPVSEVRFSDLDLSGVFPESPGDQPQDEPVQVMSPVPSSDELASEIDGITDEYLAADIPAAPEITAAVSSVPDEAEQKEEGADGPAAETQQASPAEVRDTADEGTLPGYAAEDIEASVQEAVNIEDMEESAPGEEIIPRSTETDTTESAASRELRNIFGIEKTGSDEPDRRQYSRYGQEEGKMDNRNDDQYSRNADAALAKIKKQEIIDSLVSDIKNMYMSLSDKNKTLEERERELFVKYVQLDQREREMVQRRDRLSDTTLEDRRRSIVLQDEADLIPRDNPSVVWDINRAIDSRYQAGRTAPFTLSSVEDLSEDQVHSELEELKKQQASQKEEEQRALREELEALREQVRSGRQKEEDERLRKEQEEKAELERLRQAEADRIRAEEEKKEAEKQAEIERLRKAQEELDRIHQAEEEKAELERLRREKDEQDIARMVEEREAEIRASEEQRTSELKAEMERQLNLLREEYETRYQQSHEDLLKENEELRAEKEASQKMVELAKQAAERLVEEEASLRESEKASFDEELSRIKAQHEEAMKKAEEQRQAFEEQIQAAQADAKKKAEEQRQAFEEQIQAAQADAEQRMIEEAKMRDAEREAYREELRRAREEADRAAREKLRKEENELAALKETILLGKQEAEEKVRAEMEKALLDQEKIRLEKEKAEAELRAMEDEMRRLKEEMADRESENAALQQEVRSSQDQLEDVLERAQQIEAERALLEENMKREREEAEQRRLESLKAVLEGSSDDQKEAPAQEEIPYVPEVKIVSSQDEADKDVSGTSLLDML